MRPTLFWCTACGAETVWDLADQLASIFGVSRRTIYRWFEKGQVHSRKLAKSGLRLFCVCSACGQRWSGSCDGCRIKILCQSVTQCDTLVLAPLTRSKHTPDATQMVSVTEGTEHDGA